MMDTKELLEVYKSLFETWRFEVNSHWQRSSYFAAFETVAVAACWIALTDSSGQKWAGSVVAILGIALTAVWFLNNNKTHEYAVYWLSAVGAVEQKLIARSGEPGIDFAAKVPNRKRKDLIYIRHPHLVQAPPVIFLVAWVILLGFGIKSGMIKSVPVQHAMTYESVTLAVTIASLAVSVVAVLVAKSSLSQAKQVADRDQKDWKQRKWFDVYFKADEAYDALDRFQVLYPSPSSAGWNTPEWERESHDLMRIMRTVNRIALVFPQNPEIKALFDATAAFKNMAEATSKARLNRIGDAVEGLRQRSLLDPSILD